MDRHAYKLLYNYSESQYRTIYRTGGNFKGVKFRLIENFAGSNSTFHGFNFRVLQPPTKDVKLKTPRNFYPYCIDFSQLYKHT